MERPRQRRFANRSRKGCLTCRRRRKRCDEGSPVCSNCQRVNVPCEWKVPLCPHEGRESSGEAKKSDSQPLTPTSLGHEEVVSEQSPTAPLFVDALIPGAIGVSYIPLVTTEQRNLLTYYIHTLISKVSVVTGSTRYAALYLPMAFQSRGVLDAILCNGASHLAKSTADYDPERAAYLLRVATKHQILCHNFVIECLNNTHDQSLRTSNEMIAIIMLLIALETQNGTKSSKWTKQLSCVRGIIAARGGSHYFMSSGWETQALYGHFLYFDVMESVMQGVNETELLETEKKISGQSYDNVSQDFNISGMGFNNINPVSGDLGSQAYQPHGERILVNDFPSMDDDEFNDMFINFDRTSRMDPLMGLSYSLFFMIREIGQIKQLRPRSIERQKKFFSLESKISNWRVPTELPDGSTVTGLDLAAKLDLIALSEMYRLAALILIYRTSEMHTHFIPGIAQQIMGFVARIPNGNQVEAGLIYPLFVAGGELLHWDDMEFCALKLRGIRERTKMMNIEGVEDLLTTVWRSKLNDVQKDWTEVLREQQRVICVA